MEHLRVDLHDLQYEYPPLVRPDVEKEEEIITALRQRPQEV